MSLSISIFTRDDISGEPPECRMLEDSQRLAGSERTRTELWGSDCVIELGAELLPSLAHTDLWIENDQIEDFGRECQLLLDNVGTIAARTSWDADYIALRLRNFLSAVQIAGQSGAGIVVD